MEPSQINIEELEVIEAQAKTLQDDARKLIAMMAQCPDIHYHLVQEATNTLATTANLLDCFSALREGKRERQFLGHGCGPVGAVGRCC